MDQSVAIQETLAKGENCKIAVECVSLLNDVRESKLIGLVQQSNEHALFLYSHRRMAITGDDVTLDEIIPISYDFSVVEVSSPDELAVVGADTRVRVTFFDEELVLKLPFGSQSRLFLAEVNRAWSDVCEQHPRQEPKFGWLSKYRKVSRAARPLRKPAGAADSRMSQRQRSA
ncbi:type II inositol 1,4,5-trisphosphate 5-phosphatase-like [Rhinichthys klamathensis goyatoka]|uniref:type II inositol 1,4,5-trisphosphate 5-phosphatase-like n=1 Tax=Rhinichthys klamathensis goyatoka TaxID=3034132 RepID=UPI0024B60A39|nr:type II inositol 1,4,5-trisphosphate 5-phosphatase-like [Rhinichthys klamathensis goyatoka]